VHGGDADPQHAGRFAARINLDNPVQVRGCVCARARNKNLQHAWCLLNLSLEDGPLVEEDFDVPRAPVRMDSALVVVPYPNHREILQNWRL